MQKQDTAKIWF